MKYFTALYMMPVQGLQDWLKKPESERKQAEADMKGEWDAWLAAHKDSVLKTIACGKTKKISAGSVEDAKNGIMLSSYVQASDLEAAGEIFREHPHLKIPGATIEVMETREM